MQRDDRVFFSMILDSPSNTLKCSWQGYTDMDMVKEGSEVLRYYIKRFGSRFLLVDSRTEEGPWNDSQDWILDEWMPNVKRDGLQKTAILISQDLYSLISAQEYERRAKLRGYKVKLFKHENDALKWFEK